jgi:hypothetical protein
MSLDIWMTVDKVDEDLGDISEIVFENNITHNLNTMAREAGIYKFLWRPEELGITTAGELIEPLNDGLIVLQNQKEYFVSINPKNGWRNYHNMVSFVQHYLDACKNFPEARINVSR